MILRPYQQELIGEIVGALAFGYRRILVVLPTGGGKTVVFNDLAVRWNHLSGLDGPVCIAAHRKELIRQASQKLGRAAHGIIAPWTYPRSGLPIQVGSIQTMARRSNLPRFSLVIPDEAHHSVAGQWRTFIENQRDAVILGFTATPERHDGRGLGDIYETMIHGPDIAELMADGFLTRARVFAPERAVDLSRVRTLAGDFNTGDLAAAMDDGKLTGSAVEHYAQICPGAPAIAFCASVAHAEHVADSFRRAGWRSECVHGGLGEDVRDARIGGLADGRVQILTSCDLISEGLDIPAVGAVIMLRPTQSFQLYRQMIGRGLRPVYASGFDTDTRAGRLAGIAASDKTACVVLDHAGNTIRHGMPDAAREWSLEGRKRKSTDDAAPTVRQCPTCQAIHLSGLRACPECGHEYAADAAGRAAPEETDGRLVEITPDAPALVDLLNAAQTRAEVDAIRIARGYKPGWTDLAWRSAGRRARTPWWQNQTTATDDFASLVRNP